MPMTIRIMPSWLVGLPISSLSERERERELERERENYIHSVTEKGGKSLSPTELKGRGHGGRVTLAAALMSNPSMQGPGSVQVATDIWLSVPYGGKQNRRLLSQL